MDGTRQAYPYSVFSSTQKGISTILCENRLHRKSFRNKKPSNSSKPLPTKAPMSVHGAANLESLLSSTPQCKYQIIKTYPHDINAFTEGLVFDDVFLYESTGSFPDSSSLRRLELETGNVLQFFNLPIQYFGEGITIFNDKIIQLTWRSHIGFVYEKNSFALLQTFSYPTEGWGLTNDGRKLIMSDGTSILFFLDPETFERTGDIEVRCNTTLLNNLNALAYIKGNILANVWLTNRIVIINPQSGQVKAWLDLTDIEKQINPNPEAVLNGIAYDSKNNRLFVTGKMWQKLFEIRLFLSKKTAESR
jgi:glutamine cyclotransferase